MNVVLVCNEQDNDKHPEIQPGQVRNSIIQLKVQRKFILPESLWFWVLIHPALAVTLQMTEIIFAYQSPLIRQYQSDITIIIHTLVTTQFI